MTAVPGPSSFSQRSLADGAECEAVVLGADLAVLAVGSAGSDRALDVEVGEGFVAELVPNVVTVEGSRRPAAGMAIVRANVIARSAAIDSATEKPGFRRCIGGTLATGWCRRAAGKHKSSRRKRFEPASVRCTCR
jgi:hypothetical protein